MGERTHYAPGTFSWVDLSTTDPASAKAFYGGLFGWEAQDMPMPDGGYYSMQRLDGKDVAAIAPQPPSQGEAGVPPAWQSYVTVASADEAAARAAELGATIHAGPFDVMQAGRMAVIQDPQGAFFMVWQPTGHTGAKLVNVPGALCWNDVGSPDMDASAEFYGGLFGWTFTEVGGGEGGGDGEADDLGGGETGGEGPGPMRYLAIKNGDANNGGIREAQPNEPPNWLVYFAVEDLDDSVERVGQLGGSLLAGPIEMGPARFAVLHDPQGAVFALYSGPLEG